MHVCNSYNQSNGFWFGVSLFEDEYLQKFNENFSNGNMDLVSATIEIRINSQIYIINIHSMYWLLLCCTINYAECILICQCNIETDFIYVKCDGISVFTVDFKYIKTLTKTKMCLEFESNTVIRRNSRSNCTIYDNVDYFWDCGVTYYIIL